jgi:hypothetical protein
MRHRSVVRLLLGCAAVSLILVAPGRAVAELSEDQANHPGCFCRKDLVGPGGEGLKLMSGLWMGTVPGISISDNRSEGQVTVRARGIASRSTAKGYDSASMTLYRAVASPFAATFYHYHPGIFLVFVKKGTFSYWSVGNDGDCTYHAVTAPNGFVATRELIHAEGTELGTDVEVMVTALLDPDATALTFPAPAAPTGPSCPDFGVAPWQTGCEAICAAK